MPSKYLWELCVESNAIQNKVVDIIMNSTHRVSTKRILHMANWVDKSNDYKMSLEFLENNIDSPNFHPFADPWECGGKTIDDLFKNIKGNKIVRLSTRAGGYFTISHTGGLSKSKRVKLTNKGLELGNYKFKNIVGLVTHLDEQECCICLENIVDNVSVVLKCGHIYHVNCINKNKQLSDECPMCKQIVVEDIVFDQGSSCMYEMHICISKK
jgi:hypothetical protein